MNPTLTLILTGLAFGIVGVCIPALSVLLFGTAFVMVALAVALNAIRKSF